MSVLIKNMEMPKNCSACPMLEGDRMDGLCHAASRWLDDDEYWTWYVYPEGDTDDSKPCNCPLVEVPKQKQGHWIVKSVWKLEYHPQEQYREITCSECETHVAWPTKFCPNCGAQMRGEADG